MNAYDHIDDYIAGRLAGDELVAFEQLMSEDAELRRLVDNYAEVKSASEGMLEMELLREVESVQQSLNSPKEESKKEEPEKPKGFFTIRNILISTAIAVGIGLLIGFLGNLEKSSPPVDNKALFAQSYKEPLWPVSRSVDVDNIGKAISYYLDDNQKDFNRAKKILLDSVVDVKAGRYWLAEMYAKEGMMDSMKVYLPEYDSDDRFYNRAEVLRVYALIYEGNLDEAKEAVSRLPEGCRGWFELE